MATVFTHVPARKEGALKYSWQRGAAAWADGAAYHPARRAHIATRIATIAGVALLCVFWGFAVVIAELNALIIGLALVACVLVLLDFRIGVVLLVILMPISKSAIVPHEMVGVTGLNPFNLLLAGTLGSYLLQALSDRGVMRFIPRPLLWLYIAPILVAGVMGSRHVGEIALYFFMTEQVNFTNAAGYLRDVVVRPLFLVVFALLLAAAVSRSRSTEKFLVPALISVWIICLMAIVYFFLSRSSFGDLARSTARPFFSPLGVHANDLGRMYAVAYALLLFTWAGTKDYGLKLILLASMALLVVALALTFSRAAFAAFVVVNALFLLSRRKATSLVFGCMLAAVAVVFLPDAIYDRVTHGFGAGANAISANRIDTIWIPLIPDLMRSPIYGNGLSSMLWSEAVRSGRGYIVTHPHNAYLQALLDMGVIGLILLCAYFAHVWNGFRALSTDSSLSPAQRGFYQGAAAGLVTFLLAGVAGSSLTPGIEQSFLWLAIGMMYGHRLRKTDVAQDVRAAGTG